MRGPYYLGLDAGNSKTVALIADSDGTIIGRGRGGVGDIYASEDAVSTVVSTVAAAVQSAPITIADIRHAAFRLAGVDWLEDEQHWRTSLARRLPELTSVSVKNDGFALLRCAHAVGTGVAISVGTGPAIGARGDRGVEFGGCWWIQHPIGGHELGAAAFRAVVEAELGSGPPTMLTQAMLNLLGYDNPADLLHAFTRRANPRPASDKRVAARTVLELAGGGDAVANAIIATQTQRLAELAVVSAQRVGFAADDPVPVTVGGSIPTSEHPAYRTALVAALRSLRPCFDIAVSAVSPVVGAVIDAIAEAGAPTAGPSARLRHVEHPAEFLRT